jgi:hypothetical protein
MRKLIPSILISVALVFTAFLFAGCQSSTSSVLKATAENANAECPKQIDEQLRMDAASADGNTLKFKYTLINYASTDLTAEQTEALKADLKEQAIKTFQADDAADWRKLSASCEYNCYGNDGELMFTIDITAEDYQ